MNSENGYYKLGSKDELLKAWKKGIEVVFWLHGTMYTTGYYSNKIPTIATCPDGDLVHFSSWEKLGNEYFVNGKPIIDQWEYMEIDSM